jgi:hypothetical protein
MAVFAALTPAALPGAEIAAMRAALLAEFVAPRTRPAAAPVVPPPMPAVAALPGARIFAAFVGLACLAGLLGALLLVPSSPIALTRDRSTNALPLAAQPSQPPTIIFVTPTPGPPSPAATATSSPSVTGTATITPTTQSDGAGVVVSTPTPVATKSATADATTEQSPTPSVTASASPTASVTAGHPTVSPTPGGDETCAPSLSTNVRQVNIVGGSSSFTVFNSFCRAVQFSLDAAPTSDWLHLQQLFGTLDPGAFGTVGMTVDRAARPEGTSMGSVALTWVGGSLDIPVAVTVTGGPPIVGPVHATCAAQNQANFFNARVIDDYGVQTVTLTTVDADGKTSDIAMTLASGDPRAGVWDAEPAGGIVSYTVTATDFAGHISSFPGVCSTS